MEDPPRVLILTTYDLDEYLYKAMKAGASGFVLKDVQAEQLPPAVRAIAQGDSLLGSIPTRRLIESFVSRPPPGGEPSDKLAHLSERELEVLTLLASGLSNNEIAERLFLSEATVKTHVNRLFAKASLRDRVHAVILAYETGLVEAGE
jgi:DNA-binding NarL/FixJ family response regulator